MFEALRMLLLETMRNTLIKGVRGWGLGQEGLTGRGYRCWYYFFFC